MALAPGPKRTCWRRFVPELACPIVRVTRNAPGSALSVLMVTGGRGVHETGGAGAGDGDGDGNGDGDGPGAGGPPVLPATAVAALIRLWTQSDPVPAIRSAVESSRFTTA